MRQSIPFLARFTSSPEDFVHAVPTSLDRIRLPRHAAEEAKKVQAFSRIPLLVGDGKRLRSRVSADFDR